MSLWRPPVQSNLDLAAAWAALARHHIGVTHHFTRGEWTFRLEKLHHSSSGWSKTLIAECHGDNEVEVIVGALRHLPGIAVRVALLSALMEI